MTGDGDLRIMRAGDRALLVAPRDPDELNGMIDRLRTGAVTGIQDFLPAAATVLITLEADADTTSVDRALRQMLLDHAAPTSSGEIGDVDELTIPVRYDGADLDEVAALLGVGVEEVIARHTGIVWRCEFIGFTAGFGYLRAAGAALTVPRRAQSRTAVPPGSVGLADGYSAVYPRQAPGGWQLIGSTDVPMWSLDRPSPALLAPGTKVRFVVAGSR
jgi:KipI family sensor histidine kinase inhibitor